MSKADIREFKCIETGEIFNRRQAAADRFNITSSSVGDSLRDGRPHRGYTFVYLSDLDKYTPTVVDAVRPEGIWSSVPSFEGLYEVSHSGQVWSIGRDIIRDNGKIQHVPARLLSASSEVHPTVTLTKDGQPYSFMLSHLVAITYIPNPNNYKYVNHKDGNPKNNCIDNLVWASECATYSHPKKVHIHNNSALSSDQLLEVQQALGDQYDSRDQWRLASVDSTLGYAVCSSGKYLIQLPGKNKRNSNLSAKIIKFTLTKDGYLRCSHGLLHRIVAEAFLPDWDTNLTVNHKDGNKLNNDIRNLEMLSNEANVKHYFVSPVFEGSRNARILSIKSKLTGRQGKPISEETREKLRQSSSGRVHTEEQKQKMSQARKGWWQTYGDSFRSNHPQTGKRYITDGTVCKLVTAQVAEHYIQLGWVYGMLPRR